MPPSDFTNYAGGPPPGYRYTGTPPVDNPLSSAMSYMIRDHAYVQQQRDIAQYQQMMTPPPQMSLGMQRQIAFGAQYQFGVMGGQQEHRDSYLRRSELASQAFSGAAAASAVSFGMWGTAAKVGTSIAKGVGMKGLAATAVGGLAIPLAAAAIPYEIASRGLSRSRMRADIAQDISDFAPRFTGGAGFGRAQTESLAGGVFNSMNEGGFFGAEDQLNIHKTGLASGMIKGKNTAEYKKSFESLKDNLKDVVKLMNTTIEGGLSVMKELEQAGFKSPEQQKQMIMQARGWGASTGMGTQNMMQVGVAGANAVRGTGWTAQAGATMYQGAATVAANLAGSGGAIAQLVGRAGGAAQAGGMIASSMMNTMNSGMGLQTMAAMLDPKTHKLDRTKLGALMSGEMSSGDIMAGANDFGSKGGRGGANNRLAAPYAAQDAWNSMKFSERAMAVRGVYKAWAADRGGVDKYSALAFAESQGQSGIQAQVTAAALTGNLGLGKMAAATRGQERQLRESGYAPQGGVMSRAAGAVGRWAGGWLNYAADATANSFKYGVGQLGSALAAPMHLGAAIFANNGLLDDSPIMATGKTAHLMSGQATIDRAALGRVEQQYGGVGGLMKSTAITKSDGLELAKAGINTDYGILIRTQGQKGVQQVVDKLNIMTFQGGSVRGDKALYEMVPTLEGASQEQIVGYLAGLEQHVDRTNKETRNSRVNYLDYKSGLTPAARKESEKKVYLAGMYAQNKAKTDGGGVSTYLDSDASLTPAERGEALRRTRKSVDIDFGSRNNVERKYTAQDVERANTVVAGAAVPGKAFAGASPEDKASYIRRIKKAKGKSGTGDWGYGTGDTADYAALTEIETELGISSAEMQGIKLADETVSSAHVIGGAAGENMAQKIQSRMSAVQTLPGAKTVGRAALERGFAGTSTSADLALFNKHLPSFGDITDKAMAKDKLLGLGMETEKKSMKQKAEEDYMLLTKQIKDNNIEALKERNGGWNILGSAMHNAKEKQKELASDIQTLNSMDANKVNSMSSQMQAQPAAPQVLNYWNNRWMP